MRSRLFPPRLRTLVDAVDYLPIWVETIGGVVSEGLEVTEVEETGAVVAVHIARFRSVFAAQETVLTVGMDLAADLTATWYSFDLRRIDGRLLWRHDNHPGHEALHGGRTTHLRIGPDEDHRVPAEPVTLEDVAAKIVATHINLD